MYNSYDSYHGVNRYSYQQYEDFHSYHGSYNRPEASYPVNPYGQSYWSNVSDQNCCDNSYDNQRSSSMQRIIAEQKRMIEQFQLLSAETNRLLAEREHANNQGISAGSSAARSPPPTIGSAPPSPATTFTAEQEEIINQMVADGWRFTDLDTNQSATSPLVTQQSVAESPQSVIASQQPATYSAQPAAAAQPNKVCDPASCHPTATHPVTSLLAETQTAELQTQLAPFSQPDNTCGTVSFSCGLQGEESESKLYFGLNLSILTVAEQSKSTEAETQQQLQVVCCQPNIQLKGGTFFLLSSLPLFPFDPGDKDYAGYLVDRVKRVKGEYLFAHIIWVPSFLDLILSLMGRQMTIQFPFDVKHYRWSELSS